MQGKAKPALPILALASAVLTALAPLAEAASSREIATLNSFTTMYGRAMGCGLPGLDKIGHQIGHWMDRRFPAGSQDQIAYLPVFVSGVQSSAQEQHNGQSKMSCASVESYFASPVYLKTVAE